MIERLNEYGPLTLAVLVVCISAALLAAALVRSTPPLQCRTAPGTCVLDGRTVYCVLPDPNATRK